MLLQYIAKVPVGLGNVEWADSRSKRAQPVIGYLSS